MVAGLVRPQLLVCSAGCWSVQPQRLLIRCPRVAPPPQPMPELLQGFDTATQITALAHWLRQQPPPGVARVWIALGSQCIRVGPAQPPTPSAGAWLAPDVLSRKRGDCGA